MLRQIRLMFCFIFIVPVAVLTTPVSNTQAADGLAIAQSVPVEIPQILSGGFWKSGKQSGPYRAVVVTSGKGQSFATRVYLQWVAIDPQKGDLKIVKTVPLREVNDKNLSNAYVFLEGEEEGKITLIVTSFNPKTEKENQIWISASGPGSYKIVPARIPVEGPGEQAPPR